MGFLDDLLKAAEDTGSDAANLLRYPANIPSQLMPNNGPIRAMGPDVGGFLLGGLSPKGMGMSNAHAFDIFKNLVTPSPNGTQRVTNMNPVGNQPMVSPDRSIPPQTQTTATTTNAPTAATTTSNPPSDRAKAAPHMTPWDTDVGYSVVSRLSNDEFKQPFTGAKASQDVTTKATALVLEKLNEAGITLDPAVQKAFAQGADQAIRTWYQQEKQAGHNPEVTDYYMMLTNLALASQAQVNDLKNGSDIANTSPTNSPLTPQDAQGNPITIGTASGVAVPTTDKNKMTPTEGMMTFGGDGSPWGPGKGQYYGSQDVYQAYINWLQQQQPGSRTDKTPAGFLALMGVTGGGS